MYNPNYIYLNSFQFIFWISLNASVYRILEYFMNLSLFKYFLTIQVIIALVLYFNNSYLYPIFGLVSLISTLLFVTKKYLNNFKSYK